MVATAPEERSGGFQTIGVGARSSAAAIAASKVPRPEDSTQVGILRVARSREPHVVQDAVRTEWNLRLAVVERAGGSPNPVPEVKGKRDDVDELLRSAVDPSASSRELHG